jgi:hypothetical protein
MTNEKKMSNQLKPPAFNKNDDPIYWLSRFEKAAKPNKWTDEAKLCTADSCFASKSTQIWFMDKEFESWSLFSQNAKKRVLIQSDRKMEILLLLFGYVFIY